MGTGVTVVGSFRSGVLGEGWALNKVGGPIQCPGHATCPLQLQVGTGVTVGRLSYLSSPGKGWALNNPGAPIQCQGRHGLARVSRVWRMQLQVGT